RRPRSASNHGSRWRPSACPPPTTTGTCSWSKVWTRSPPTRRYDPDSPRARASSSSWASGPCSKRSSNVSPMSASFSYSLTTSWLPRSRSIADAHSLEDWSPPMPRYVKLVLVLIALATGGCESCDGCNANESWLEGASRDDPGSLDEERTAGDAGHAVDGSIPAQYLRGSAKLRESLNQ